MSESSPESVQNALSLAEIAEAVAGRLSGDGAVRIHSVAPIDGAGPGQMALLTARKYTRHAEGSKASAFMVTEEFRAHLGEGRPHIVVDEPQRALITLLTRLHPAVRDPAGVHPTAVLGRGVRLAKDVGIGPYAVLGDDVAIGEGTRIGAHVVLGERTHVGRDCDVHPQAVLYPRTVLGDGVIVQSGARIGSDGFGYAFLDGAHRRVPHAGRVVIGDHVEIGANTTIDRGSVGDTEIGSGVKVDNLVQLAHNVRIGDLTLIAALVGIAGSTRVGKGVWLGGQAGAINGLEIGDGAKVAVATKILRDVPAGETVSGHPARPHREDLHRQAQVGRLSKLVDRVRALEAEIESLRAAIPPGDEQ